MNQRSSPVRPRKKCRYCHALFDARNRFQQACLKPTCQKQRRRATNRANYLTHRYDRDFVWEKRKQWQTKNGRDFMRNYRKDNPAYVKKNRDLQRIRDRKKKNLVKSDLRKSLRVGNLMRIHVLEQSCKVRLVRVVSL